METLETYEREHLMLIDAALGGIVMTMQLWQLYFSEPYVRNGDDREFLAFCDKCRAVINFRRGFVSGIEANAGTTKLFEPSEPLRITVVEEDNMNTPVYIGFQREQSVEVEEFKQS